MKASAMMGRLANDADPIARSVEQPFARSFDGIRFSNARDWLLSDVPRRLAVVV
jgi:hypothetical protein